MQQSCAYCGAELRDETVQHAVTHGSRMIVFTDVPARVCRPCGESFFAGAVVDKMNQYVWGLGAVGDASGADVSVHVNRFLITRGTGIRAPAIPR